MREFNIVYQNGKEDYQDTAIAETELHKLYPWLFRAIPEPEGLTEEQKNWDCNWY